MPTKFLYILLASLFFACGPELDPLFEEQLRKGTQHLDQASSGSEGETLAPSLLAEEEDPNVSSESNEATVPTPSKLVINELLYDVTGSDDGKVFIELFGTPETSISGYKVIFVNGDNGATTDSIVLPKGATLNKQGLFVIADTKTGGQSTEVINANFGSNFDPQNGPDCVVLLDPKGKSVDALAYGTLATTTSEGGQSCQEGQAAVDGDVNKSLSRVEGSDSDDNAVDFVVLDTPTPGTLGSETLPPDIN
ncbi:MAG: lamin tail domain-containing protein [Deltaproteobacteria bacterium]|nr:lamin tail domain-containing protein [Deltaproteobacteria bacterium]